MWEYWRAEGINKNIFHGCVIFSPFTWHAFRPWALKTFSRHRDNDEDDKDDGGDDVDKDNSYNRSDDDDDDDDNDVY